MTLCISFCQMNGMMLSQTAVSGKRLLSVKRLLPLAEDYVPHWNSNYNS